MHIFFQRFESCLRGGVILVPQCLFSLLVLHFLMTGTNSKRLFNDDVRPWTKWKSVVLAYLEENNSAVTGWKTCLEMHLSFNVLWYTPKREILFCINARVLLDIKRRMHNKEPSKLLSLHLQNSLFKAYLGKLVLLHVLSTERIEKIKRKFFFFFF